MSTVISSAFSGGALQPPAAHWSCQSQAGFESTRGFVVPQLYVDRVDSSADACYFDDFNLAFDHKRLIQDYLNQQQQQQQRKSSSSATLGLAAVATESAFSDLESRSGDLNTERSIEANKTMESFNLDEALDEQRFVHLKSSAEVTTATVEPCAEPGQINQSRSDSRLAVDSAGQLNSQKSNQSSPSSSLECLSADEGYVGSYSSDQCSRLVKRNRQLEKEKPIVAPVSLATSAALETTASSSTKINSPLILDELQRLVSFLLLAEETDASSSAVVEIPEMFSSHKAPFETTSSDDAFMSLLEQTDELDRLLNEPSLPALSEFGLVSNDEETQRFDLAAQQMTAHTNQKQRSEFWLEDLIDTNAYLNEIEMNLDYFQSELTELYEHHGSSSYWHSDPMSIDTLLTYKSNREAFNLRDCHRHFIRERSPVPVVKITPPPPPPAPTALPSGTFANIKVDSIAEFIPPAQMKIPKYQEADDESHSGIEAYDPENQDSTVVEHDQAYNDEEGSGHAYYDEKFAGDAETGAYYEQNGAAESGAAFGEVDESQQYLHNEGSGVGYDENYYGEPQDIEAYEDCDYDYDFQMLVDSMTEKDALDLLASQSELYALQVAQAAKLGITVDLSPENEFGECGAGVDATSDMMSSSGGVKQELEGSAGHVDLFENIFSYDEQLAEWPKDSNVGKESISSKSSSAWSSLASEQAESNSNMSESSESYPVNTLTNSNTASLSLRTSLLKLLQTRHHLTRLLKQQQQQQDNAAKPGLMSATSNSSAASSLTTSSLFLNKQSMNNNFQSMSKKPCVYKLNDGHCSRADCRFAHDFKSITCKYWLEGECLKGEACEFLHDIIEQPASLRNGNRRASLSSNSSAIFGKKSAKKAVKQPDFKLDSEEFPALGGAPAQVTISIESEKPAAPPRTQEPRSDPTPANEAKTMTLAAKLKSSMEKKPKAANAAQKSKNNSSSLTLSSVDGQPAEPRLLLSGTLTASNKMNQIPNKKQTKLDDDAKKPALTLTTTTTTTTTTLSSSVRSNEAKNENKPCEKKNSSASEGGVGGCGVGRQATAAPASKKASNITIANYGIEILNKNSNVNGGKTKKSIKPTKKR